jgi:hypothetical protein
MRRAIALGILALTAMLAISAWAQAQSSTGQQTGLTNPGFEEPRVQEGSFVLVETMPGWKTTDTHFEIWGTGFMDVAAHEGTQFVELNAYIDGTLYQDSTGIQRGSLLEFTFAHRGRNGDDTMKLTIGDLGADNSLDGGDDTVLFTNEYTTGKDAWAVYDSTTEQKIKALGNSVMFAYWGDRGYRRRPGTRKSPGRSELRRRCGERSTSGKCDETGRDGGAFTFGYRTIDQPGFTEFPNTDSPHPGITRRNRADGEYFSYAQNTRDTEFKAQSLTWFFIPPNPKAPGHCTLERIRAMSRSLALQR